MEAGNQAMQFFHLFPTSYLQNLNITKVDSRLVDQRLSSSFPQIAALHIGFESNSKTNTGWFVFP